ncbi:hypothetical protein VF21_10289 [Pseudogymnoascus sp. 05NY08]|nr:hypothetical protein VF21_10289 [Pseudogymnoascus sp. 05NY08]
MAFKSWQVVGLKALLDFAEDHAISGCILADNTGLGKTIQCLGFLAKKLEVREGMLEAHREWAAGDRASPEPPRPILLVVPGEIIQQWAGDIKNFDPKMISLVYYGSEALTIATTGKKVDGPLLRGSVHFDGSERNARTIILTSPDTLRARHGPTRLLNHRMNDLGWTKIQAEDAWRQPDRTWERDLSGLFEFLVIDEAHCIKNASTAISTTIKWMQPPFTILATATVLPNGINDFEGFVNIIQANTDLWTLENLQQWGVRRDVNPYEPPDDHPAAVLRMTLHAVHTWITGPNASLEKRGFYLEKAWKRCLLRRTYASKDPSDHNKVIGESLPRLFSRRIICRFSPDEQRSYNELSAMPLQKLAHFLPDGKVCWNRKHARNLMLLSTALSYQWTGDYVTADQVKGWKAKKGCLWSRLELIRDSQVKATGKCDFDLPEKHEIAKQLALICRGSPKLRQLLQIVASLVVLAGRKIGIWCSLPANQILLHACFQALQIDSATYTAELSSEERHSLVKKFTTKTDECHIFVGSYAVGSVGLNLQNLCNDTIEFDSPMNEGEKVQATGRFRRLTQPHTVKRFELSVEDSFQSRIIRNAMVKALFGATAELSITVNEQEKKDADDNMTTAFTIGKWFRIEDELIEAPDIRVDHLPGHQQLSPEALVAAILDISRGRREESMLNRRWVEEAVRDDTEMDLT